MRFDEAVKELSPATVEALRVLESEGFQVFLDVRIEDCTKPDGQRRRTFANRGRYAVGALLKNLSGRERVEFSAFAPAEVAQETVTYTFETVELASDSSAVADRMVPEPLVAEPPAPAKEKRIKRKGAKR